MRDQNEVSSGAPRETPVIVTVVFAVLTVSLLAVVWLIVPLHGARGSALLGSSIFFPDDLLNLSILEWGRKAILGADKTVSDGPSGIRFENRWRRPNRCSAGNGCISR